MRRRWGPIFAVLIALVPFGAEAPAGADHTERPASACPHRTTDEVIDDNLAPAGLERGTTIHCVHAGGGDVYAAGGAPITLTRFYPDTLRVHRGDIVEFRPAPGWAGTVHTPAFLPEDADVAAVPEPLATAVPDLVRSDEVPRAIVFHQDISVGSVALDHCGMKRGSRANAFARSLPCELGPDAVTKKVSYDLNEAFIHAGRPAPFWVRVNLAPGTYRYHCTYHPWMLGQIEVVPDGEPVADQDAVAAAAAAEASKDVAEALALRDELSKPTWTRLPDGRRTWKVTVGANTDSGHATIIGYLPSHLSIRKGDEVEFVAGRPGAPTEVGRTGEAQTVTFPASLVGRFFLDGCSYETCDGTPEVAGREFPGLVEERVHPQAVPHGLTLTAFPWGCEYDDWNGGAPALPTWAPRVGCRPVEGPLVTAGAPPVPSEASVARRTSGLLEFTFGESTADVQAAPGNAVATALTLHNSGWLVPSSYAWPNKPDDQFWRGAPWPTTFAAAFPNLGEFTFACLLHPDVMTGSIEVAS